jgi:hypothetical protein
MRHLQLLNLTHSRRSVVTYKARHSIAPGVEFVEIFLQPDILIVYMSIYLDRENSTKTAEFLTCLLFCGVGVGLSFRAPGIRWCVLE